MPTQQTKSIGSSISPARDYLTPALWAAALPSNLVTADEQWEGQCYNDSEFTGIAGGIICDLRTSRTTDSTHKITLTTAPGQSWIDNASVATNAMKYDQSKGVGFRKTGSYDAVLYIQNCAYITISKIQAKADATTNPASGFYVLNGSDNTQFLDLFMHTQSTYCYSMYSSGGLCRNCVGYIEGASGNCFYSGQGARTIACTAVRNSAQSAAGTGFNNIYPNNDILVSCCAFGFTTPAISTGWHATNSKYNGTDQASGLPGTNNTYSITYNGTTPFTDADVSGGIDLIPISGTGLAGNGFYDSTYAPNDIIGTARAANPTIGARQIAAAAGSTSDYLGIRRNRINTSILVR